MNQIRLVDMAVDVWGLIISKIGDDDLGSLSLVSTDFLSITNHHKQTLNISDWNSSSLPALFRRFPNLKHLSFHNFSGDPVPILLQIAGFNIPLESLKFLPVEALRRLPPSVFSGVKSLKFRGGSDLCDDDLSKLPTFFPNLEDLDLSILASYYGGDYGEFITDDGISVLASKLQCLRRINLKGNKRVSKNGLLTLLDNCPNLEEIVLDDDTRLAQTRIGISLQSIRIHGYNWREFEFEIDDIRDYICGSSTLSEIVLSGSTVSAASLCAMAEAALPLKRATISCGGFTCEALSSFLKAYDSLHYLALEFVGFLSDASMGDLAMYLTTVRVLKLNHCTNLSEATLFTLIEQCPSLQTIEMEETSVGGGGESGDFATVSQIRTLNLSSNEHLSDRCLSKIALLCPDLETLNMRSCPTISGVGVAKLFRSCHRLRHLEIGGCSGVKKLGLHRNACELEFLGMSKLGHSDNDLIYVSKKCPNLVILDLEGCSEVTSKGVIQVVDKCTNLKEINFSGCKDLDPRIVSWMVFCKLNLRKIVLPSSQSLSPGEKKLYLRQGCYVGCLQARYW